MKPPVDLGREPPRRILAVKLSSFGDIVHATPSLHAIATAFPAASLYVAIESRWRDVLRYDPRISGVVESRSRTALTPAAVSEIALRLAASARRIGRFDMAIDLQGSRRSAAWVYLSGARIRTGRGRVRPGWLRPAVPDLTRHAIRVMAELCENLGVPVTSLAPRLYTGADEEAALDRRLERAGAPAAGYVLLNPFSRWDSKSWAVDKSARLLTRLRRECGVPVILSGGAADRPKARSVLRRAEAAGTISLAGALPLGEALCLFRRARLMISCDSGPMHAAAAFGVPVLALFGPTHPERTGPWGTGHVVLQAARPVDHHAYRRDREGRFMAALGVDAVFAAAAGMLASDANRAAI
jgi:ADP-heptose:LPS heptosyltransferase